MSRSRPQPRTSTPRRARAAMPPALANALLFGVPVLAALWVHAGALGAFLSTDDLILFERAGGIAAFPLSLWRALSGQVYFRLLWPAFGANPAPWHAVGLLLHLCATALVAAWARRMGASRTASALAAVLFGATAHARTVTWPVTGVGESLAAIFALLALVRLADDTLRARIETPLLQALGLLSKESMALAPLAALAGAADAAERSRRLRAALVPLALSLALAAYLVMTRPASGSLGGEAYAFGLGAHVWQHFCTYALWSADLVHLSGGIDVPTPLPWAAAALLALGALTLFAWRSGTRPARAGLVLWFVTLLPVLPLTHALYPHYLYLPRAGFALAFACALTALAPRHAWARGALAVTTGAFCVLTSLMYLSAMQHVLVPELGVPRDPFLRKMAVIRNAAADARTIEGGSVVVFTPPGSIRFFDTRTGESFDTAGEGQRQYSLLEAVLDEGRALRVLNPAIREVRFAAHAAAADAGCVLATNVGDGHLAVHGRAPKAYAAMAAWWDERGYAEAAAALRAEAAALDSAAALAH